jgi:hypothetical protein
MFKDQNSFSNSHKNDFLDAIASEIEGFYRLSDFTEDSNEKKIISLYNFHFGIFSKKIFLSFWEGKIIDYKIKYFFLGLCIRN